MSLQAKNKILIFSGFKIIDKNVYMIAKKKW